MIQFLFLVAGTVALSAFCLAIVWALGWGVEKRKRKIQSEVVKLKEDTIGAMIKQHDAVSLLGEVNDLLKTEYGYQKPVEFRRRGE